MIRPGEGYAIEMQGMAARPSKDIDSFSAERAGLSTVADGLIDKRQQLLEVAAERNPGFSTEIS